MKVSPNVVVIWRPLKPCWQANTFRQSRGGSSAAPNFTGTGLEQGSGVGLERSPVGCRSLSQLAKLVIEIWYFGFLQFFVDLVKERSKPRHRRSSCIGPENCLGQDQFLRLSPTRLNNLCFKKPININNKTSMLPGSFFNFETNFPTFLLPLNFCTWKLASFK